jgi:hypothetical protein
MSDVTWLAHPRYPGYEASSDGRVRSIDRYTRNGLGTVTFRAGTVLRPSINRLGYQQIAVSLDGRSRSLQVHAFVCEAFHGARPPGMAVRHLNGNQVDNRPENLVWGTKSENELDKVRHGTNPNTAKTHCAKGHEYTESNTYRALGAPNIRACRQCRKIRGARATQARTAARRAAKASIENVDVQIAFLPPDPT